MATNNNNNRITIATIEDASGPVEEFIIQNSIANFIIEEVDANAFQRFADDLGCSVGKRLNKPGIWVVLNGKSEEEKDEHRDQILNLLKKAEDALGKRQQEGRMGFKSFLIILRMHIPSQKCGYVRGKQNKTLDKIKMDYGVFADMKSSQIDEEEPEGFGRLTIRSRNVEGLRGARREIGHLIRAALDINPGGLANGRKVMSDDAKVEEHIKMPPFNQFNPEQKAQYKKIAQFMKTSGVCFIPKKVEGQPTMDAVLIGKQDMILETKKWLGILLRDYEMSRTRVSVPPRHKRPQCQLLVPFPNFLGVLGPNGSTIEKLKAQLGVDLRFLGDNAGQYPDGRYLRIIGSTEVKVEEAKCHIEETFIRKRQNYRGEERDQVQMDISVPELVAQKAAKIERTQKMQFFCQIQAKHNIECHSRGSRPRPNGTELMVLKGARANVEAAVAELEEMGRELEKNGGKWANDGPASEENGRHGGSSGIENEEGEGAGKEEMPVELDDTSISPFPLNCSEEKENEEECENIIENGKPKPMVKEELVNEESYELDSSFNLSGYGEEEEKGEMELEMNGKGRMEKEEENGRQDELMEDDEEEEEEDGEEEEKEKSSPIDALMACLEKEVRKAFEKELKRANQCEAEVKKHMRNMEKRLLASERENAELKMALKQLKMEKKEQQPSKVKWAVKKD